MLDRIRNCSAAEDASIMCPLYLLSLKSMISTIEQSLYGLRDNASVSSCAANVVVKIWFFYKSPYYFSVFY